MPAPTPIDIRYGSPTALGGLAAATGTAGYRLESQQRDQDMWLQRANMDNQFLMAEAQRRADNENQDALLHFRYGESARDQSNTDRAFALQSAVAEDRSTRGYASMDSREAIAEANRQAVAARRAGSASSGKPAADLSLVPATGDINPRVDPTAQIISQDGGRSIERYRGQNIAYTDPNSRDLLRSEVDANPPATADMVTRDVRGQLDYIESLKGRVPEDTLNSMRVAARSGKLKMDQLIDDARMAAPKDPRLTRDLASKEAEKMSLQASQIDAMLNDPNISDQVRASYARQALHLDPLLYRNEARAIQELKNHRQALGVRLSATKPVTNSSGKSLTGGNVVTIDSQEEFDGLPSGTYYRDAQSGQLERKP